MNQKKLEERYSSGEVKMCKRKKRFLTRASAILEHVRKHREGLCSHFLRAYQCTCCDYWHLTKDDPRNLLPFKDQQEIIRGFKLTDYKELERQVKAHEQKAKKERRAGRKNKH
jgi:hypothetical protein